MKIAYEELPVSLGRFKSQPKIGFQGLGGVRQNKASFCQDEIQKKSLGLGYHIYSFFHIYTPFLT